uniref:NADH dehydrogenase subunit 2 n=1 Tax=Megaxyela euchroma TaxID=1874363 RepID=UPI002209B04D|nr:NADH dehydrogenase subunit 2 [Megaxyela euchroma]UXP85883.1 NADH dehydrogenase subunit 2 [Megaxyela euchroma]
MYKIMFLSSMITGTLMSVSSTSWFSAWMGLEINLLSFIPLISNTKVSNSTEASLKYFLSQTIASSVLLMSAITLSISMNMPIKNLMLEYNTYANLMITCSLLMKMGATPFHFWFPGVMEGLSWMNCLILMTWQKIAPLMLMSYCINYVNNKFMMMIIIMTMITGTIGGLNQTSLRKLMAYSSINHLSWMLAAVMVNETLWNMYMIIYSFLSISIVNMMNVYNLSYINQMYLFKTNNMMYKFSMMMLMLSLGGLPPFIGFLPKWLTIQMMIKNNFMFMTSIMVMMTLITLFYYMRISFSAFMLSYSETKWNMLIMQITDENNNEIVNNCCFKVNMLFTFLSLTGLSISTTLIKLM